MQKNGRGGPLLVPLPVRSGLQRVSRVVAEVPEGLGDQQVADFDPEMGSEKSYLRWP
jgi:hypothetical protein